MVSCANSSVVATKRLQTQNVECNEDISQSVNSQSRYIQAIMTSWIVICPEYCVPRDCFPSNTWYNVSCLYCNSPTGQHCC